MKTPKILWGVALTLSIPALSHAQQLYSTSGAVSADILATVNQFRTDMGGVNNGIGASGVTTGRREINWDAVPNGFTAPNLLPGNFFNQNSQRGVHMTTVGTTNGFMVSDAPTGGNGVGIEFDNLNPTYSASFQTFSPTKLFAPLGGTTYDINFFVPLTGPALPGSTAALVTGFGAVFTDVDAAGSQIEAFDQNGTSLGVLGVPILNNGLSFVAMRFNVPTIARVRVTQGTLFFGPNDGAGGDIVATDDFIYGEPNAIVTSTAPEPTTLALLTLGGVVGLRLRRRR